MSKQLHDLSPEDLDALIDRAVDRRLGVFMQQLLDAIPGAEDEDGADFAPEFATSLRRSIERASRGDGISLRTFREQIGG
jgi:hypothetical protein